MGTVRVQAVFQGATALPEDRYVGTFHFANETAFSTHQAAALAAVATFYNTGAVLPSAQDPVGSFFPGYVLRPYTLNAYDMTTAAPRVPITVTSTLPAVKTGGLGSVPHEAAVCLSLRGAPPVTSRRRGRLYFGPLNSTCVTAGTTTTPARPSSNIMGALAYSALRLINTADLDWSIYSPTTSSYVPIVGGWVDNEFDTQRRRGNEATARTQWGA